jgi:hypothetical protein
MGGLAGGLGTNVAWMLPSLGHLPWYTGMAGFSAVLVGSWALARTIYVSVVGQLGHRLSALTDTLEQRLRESMAPK